MLTNVSRAVRTRVHSVSRTSERQRETPRRIPSKRAPLTRAGPRALRAGPTAPPTFPQPVRPSRRDRPGAGPGVCSPAPAPEHHIGRRDDRGSRGACAVRWPALINITVTLVLFSDLVHISRCLCALWMHSLLARRGLFFTQSSMLTPYELSSPAHDGPPRVGRQ